MKGTTAFLITLFALSAALPTVHVTGKKFFTPDGNQFYVVGVDYQPTATSRDPLADVDGLKRDLPYLQQLGVNMIRVYSSDVNNNHDEGMALLDAAGIYVLLDATDPSFSIDANSPTWTTDIFSGIQNKISLFSKYSNVFGFLAGNEVILTQSQTNAGQYIKAAVRDIKSYLQSIGSKALVGYAATDVAANDYLQPFLDCESEETSVDFYGLNTYRWCNGDTYQTSGYAGSISRTYDRPFIYTEFGCNRVSPRTFDEIQAIYSSQMTNDLSGGFVYEYSQEANSYGLVQVNGYSASTLPDFDNLKAQLAKINPAKVKESAYTPPTSTVVDCPAKSSVWQSQAFPLPPTPDATKCSCMASSVTCTVNPSATVSQIQSAVSTACGSVSCASITSNWTSASYGDYSMCSSFQRAAIALNTYYTAYSSSQGSDACNFGGVGKIQKSSGCAGVATVVASKTQSATQSMVQTSQVIKSQTQGVTQTASNSNGQLVTESASASVTATAQVTAIGSQSVVEVVTESKTPVNRYQTQWNDAFNAGTMTAPLVGLLVAAIMLIIA